MHEPADNCLGKNSFDVSDLQPRPPDRDGPMTRQFRSRQPNNPTKLKDSKSQGHFESFTRPCQHSNPPITVKTANSGSRYQCPAYDTKASTREASAKDYAARAMHNRCGRAQVRPHAATQSCTSASFCRWNQMESGPNLECSSNGDTE